MIEPPTLEEIKAGHEKIRALYEQASVESPPLAVSLEAESEKIDSLPLAVSLDDGLITGGYDIKVMNEQWAVVPVGTGVVYIQERLHVKDTEKVMFRSPMAVMELYRHKKTQVMGKKEPVWISWAERWREDSKRRQYDGVTFYPLGWGEKISNAQAGYFNLFRGFSIAPRFKKGGYAIFADHLLTHVCNGDEDMYQWLFGWFAHIIQKPRERFGTAVVLCGGMGSGKSIVGEVFGHLLKEHYFMVDSDRYVTGQFNAHMASCLLLQAEEAVWAGSKDAAGRLKSLITSKEHMIEQKGVDAIRLENYIRLLMTSNEDWVVPAGADERRFLVLKVNNNVAQNHAYFGDMMKELNDGGYEALLQDLIDFDLSSVALRVIPKTMALFDQKLESAGFFFKWWHDKLDRQYLGNDGANVAMNYDFGDNVFKETLYKDYLKACDDAQLGRRYTINVFGKSMKAVVGEERLRVTREGSGQRRWGYKLPALDVCRQGLEAYFKQPIPWQQEDEVS